MRLPSVDVLRLLTVSLIVYRHTFGSSDILLASVGVPFFFFLTGWLWRPGRRTVKEEISHRWRTLGIPYLSWLLLLYPIYLAAFYIQGELTLQRTVAPLLGGSYVGAAYTTFWFISALLLVGIMMRLLDRLSETALIVLGLGLLAIGGLFGEQLAEVPLGIGVAVPSLGFAIIGRLAGQWSCEKSGKFTALLLLIPAILLAFFFFEPLNIKYGDFGTPMISGALTSLITWGVLVTLDSLFRLIPFSARMSTWLGPLTSVAIVVVLTHPVVLWAMAFFQHNSTPPVWVYLMALILPWIMALAIKQTRLSPYLIGQPYAAVSPRTKS